MVAFDVAEPPPCPTAGADVRPDAVRVFEPELVSEPDDELPHRTRRQERVATLGMAQAPAAFAHAVLDVGEMRK